MNQKERELNEAFHRGIAVGFRNRLMARYLLSRLVSSGAHGPACRPEVDNPCCYSEEARRFLDQEARYGLVLTDGEAVLICGAPYVPAIK